MSPEEQAFGIDRRLAKLEGAKNAHEAAALFCFACADLTYPVMNSFLSGAKWQAARNDRAVALLRRMVESAKAVAGPMFMACDSVHDAEAFLAELEQADGH